MERLLLQEVVQSKDSLLQLISRVQCSSLNRTNQAGKIKVVPPLSGKRVPIEERETTKKKEIRQKLETKIL